MPSVLHAASWVFARCLFLRPDRTGQKTSRWVHSRACPTTASTRRPTGLQRRTSCASGPCRPSRGRQRGGGLGGKIVLSPHRKARRLPGYDQNARVIHFGSGRDRDLLLPRRWEMTALPRAVEAMARVFGPGCTNLIACGVSVQSIAALHSFVTSTNGGLLALCLSNCAVSPDALFLMCRASPNLLCLNGLAIREHSRCCNRGHRRGLSQTTKR